MKPDLSEAMGIVERACSTVQGDLRTHQAIQDALKKIREKLAEEPKKK